MVGRKRIGVWLSDSTWVERMYSNDDQIWKLDVEKRERQLIADVQRDAQLEADKHAQKPVVTRG